MAVIIKKMIIITSLVFFTLGCAKNNPEPQKANKKHVKNSIDNTKPRYIYNDNFHVKYSKRKVVWFAPYITKDGDVVSERTVSILPAYPTWSSKAPEKTKISKEILDFLSEQK